jgi:hypothetical protein
MPVAYKIALIGKDLRRDPMDESHNLHIEINLVATDRHEKAATRFVQFHRCQVMKLPLGIRSEVSQHLSPTLRFKERIYRNLERFFVVLAGHEQ